MSEQKEVPLLTAKDAFVVIGYCSPDRTPHFEAIATGQATVISTAELEALRADKARLDFLDNITVDYDPGMSAWIGGNVCTTVWDEGGLRGIADAAMKIAGAKP